MSTAVAVPTDTDHGMDTLHVLWMDDEPAFISDVNRLLAAEEIPLAFDVATSIGQAEALLETGAYCGFIADCLMDPDDPDGANGAEFVRHVNEEHPCLPTFVYSGFRDDVRFRADLSEANTVYQADRASTDWESPLLRVPLIAKVLEYGRMYNEVKDLYPENVPFSEYIQAPDRFRWEVEIHWKKHGIWIATELRRRGWTWGVACGVRLVRGSADIRDFPDDDELKAIGERHHLIPFAYAEPAMPEEMEGGEGPAADWNGTEIPGDWYPTLAFKLSSELLVEDFDTGAWRTHVSDGLVTRSAMNFWRSAKGVHLDEPYEFLTKKVPITLVDKGGGERSKKIAVNVVKNWGDSPFVKINHQRRVLLGRDILGAFPAKVVLNSQSRTSCVQFLEVDA